MGRTRNDLHKIFERILHSNNVYFNPPANVRLQYPCIMYKLDNLNIQRADNVPYHIEDRYSVSLITFNPDSKFIHELAMIPKTSFDRSYVSDGLYHYVYTVYI